MEFPDQFWISVRGRVRCFPFGETASAGGDITLFASAGGDITLFAIEPDPYMRRQAVERARDLELDIEIENAGAEALPFADDSFDVVIASLVFYTIPDFDVALSEVARVLKPGGEFRFLEHVRWEATVGVAHDVLAPAWRTVAGGCHLVRETDEMFRDDDRFELVDHTRLEEIPQVVPIVRGTLKRRRDGSFRAITMSERLLFRNENDVLEERQRMVRTFHLLKDRR